MVTRASRLHPVGAALGLLATVAMAACGGDGAGDPEAFCADVVARAPELRNPQIATDDDIDRYLTMFEDLGREVPLAIEEEWEALTQSLQTAADVPPGDAAAQQAALEEAYSTQEAGQTIQVWVAEHCGIDVATGGPVANADPNATTTTTMPGVTVPATGG